MAALACERVTDAVNDAVSAPTPESEICKRIDDPTMGGNWPRPVTDCGEFVVVTTVVVTPAQVFSVSFQATEHAFTDTTPLPLVTETPYVEPSSVRFPLLLTEKYCTGESPPLENVNDVVDGVAFQVADVMVCAPKPCAPTAAKTGVAAVADTLRRTAATATALLSCVSPRRTR